MNRSPTAPKLTLHLPDLHREDDPSNRSGAFPISEGRRPPPAPPSARPPGDGPPEGLRAIVENEIGSGLVVDERRHIGPLREQPVDGHARRIIREHRLGPEAYGMVHALIVKTVDASAIWYWLDVGDTFKADLYELFLDCSDP